MAKKEDRPLYQHVKAAILEHIENEKLVPGDALPTEAELEAKFKVSRTTIRSAIGELQNEGYLTRQQGRGTFVSNNSYEDCQAKLQSFTEDVSKRNICVRTVLIGLDLIVPDNALKNEMQITIDEPVLRIQRLRYTDDIPSILTSSFLPKYSHEKLSWKEIDFSQASLYKEMEKVGIDFAYGEEAVEVYSATVYEASLLQIAVGSPMSLNRRKVYNAAGQMIEYSRSLTRGDRYRLHIKLRK